MGRVRAFVDISISLRMWLLNTSTAEQKFFADPNDVPGGYAILSHVWDSEEDNFKSVRKAVEKAQDKANQALPRGANAINTDPQYSAGRRPRKARRRLFQVLRRKIAAIVTAVCQGLLRIFRSSARHGVTGSSCLSEEGSTHPSPTNPPKSTSVKRQRARKKVTKVPLMPSTCMSESALT